MKKLGILIILIGGVLLSGCATKSKTAKAAPPSEKAPVDALNSMTASGGLNKTRVSAMRAIVLRDTAMSVGARTGLAWRAKQLNTILLQNERELRRVFNFQAMLLDNNILPPVLIEGRNTLTLGGKDTIRIADRNYQILSQAKFVTAPPTWRDYLWLSYQSPEKPDRSLLPKNADERLVWKKYIKEGWQAGIQQADLIYKENLARLKRDFEGMVRYRSLLAQNMVSAPFVAQVDMGITATKGGQDLTVNDRVLRITAFPELQSKGEQWKTEMTKHE